MDNPQTTQPNYQFRITTYLQPKIDLLYSVGNIRTAHMQFDSIGDGQAYFSIFNNKNKTKTCEISLSESHFQKCDLEGEDSDIPKSLIYSMIRFCRDNRKDLFSDYLRGRFADAEKTQKYNNILDHLISLLPRNKPTKSVNMARPTPPSDHADGAGSGPDSHSLQPVKWAKAPPPGSEGAKLAKLRALELKQEAEAKARTKVDENKEGTGSGPDPTNPSKSGGKRKKASKKASKKARSNKKSRKRRRSAKRSRKTRRSSKNTKSKRKSRGSRKR